MDPYKETFETWNKVAELYQEKFMDLKIYNESYDLICSLIPAMKASLLEIGCGPGNITRYLLSKRPDFNIHGIDIAPSMIDLAIANNPGATFEVMDIRNIDLLNKKFDGIICGFCLPYLSASDLEKLLNDVATLLIENGLLYLSFVEGDPVNSGFRTGSSGDRVYFQYYQSESIIDIFAKKQLELIKIMKVEYIQSNTESEIHTILLARLRTTSQLSIK